MAGPIKPVPDGFHTITPYIIVPGVPQLMDFLALAFGAVEIDRHLRPDGTVQHAQMKVGDSRVMMAEPQGQWTPRPASILVYIENVDAVHAKALAAGATEIYAPMDHFYGDRSGGVTDPCGNQWFISTHIEDVSPEELKRRMAAAGK